jgi:UDP-N-acetylmuramyl pentapeptide synthase
LDVLVVVGDYAGVVAEAAKKAKMPAKSVIVCKSAEDALVACLSLIKSGDLVLIKASKAVGLKTVVEGLTVRAEKLA